jgi:hypothetical protein
MLATPLQPGHEGDVERRCKLRADAGTLHLAAEALISGRRTRRITLDREYMYSIYVLLGYLYEYF